MVDASSRFRAGVAILVVNSDGLVLVLERIDVSGAWQVPQGGLLDGESPIDAANRELREETGIAWEHVELLEEHPLWVGYKLPAQERSEKTGRGQVHKWFLVRYRGHAIVLDGQSDEFVRWRWMRMADLLHAVWELRRPTYARIASDWAAFLA